MAARRPHTTPSAAAGPSTPPATFAELGVPTQLVRVLASSGVSAPFPIQAATLPDALAGRDVLGRGRTGSGKTYAFVIPLLARLAASGTPRLPGRPRALILAPTRELASQIDAAMAPLAKALALRTLTVFGGVGSRPQITALRAGVDVLVACPGRLADHLASGHARLDAVEITVLDEADHMADLGFLPIVRRLLDQTPRTGQRLLFSASLDQEVDVLVRRFLRQPVVHSVDAVQPPANTMAHHVLHVDPGDRFAILTDLASAPGRTMVFTRTKRGAKTLTRRLVAAGVPAVELHGNLAQTARARNLSAFSSGAATTLVATDIAARGIHIDDVELVIHADPPAEHKAYLHRSGRTARAGATGVVVTLMTDAQVSDVRSLTRRLGITPTTARSRPGDPFLSELAPGRRQLTPQPVARSTARSVEPPATARNARRGARNNRVPAHTGQGCAQPTSARVARNSATPPRQAGSGGEGRSTGRTGGAAAFSARSRVGGRR